MTLRRGFKALAERNSASARDALGLTAVAPLDAWRYAEHLRVVVADFESLGLTPECVQQLIHVDSASWSAMTLFDRGIHLIVVNPAHAPTRKQSDLMHELAHIELGHAPTRVEVSATGLLLLSDYADDQEQEADWHAGALLLPRDGILQLLAQGSSVASIARYYGVSEALCEWRVRMTGCYKQMQRRAR